MLRIIKPTIDQFFTFSHHVLVWIRSRQGILEIDFNKYTQLRDKWIFLAPKQYVKFLWGGYRNGYHRILSAIHKFFANQVETQDFDGTHTADKAAMVEKMSGFLNGIQTVWNYTSFHDRRR